MQIQVLLLDSVALILRTTDGGTNWISQPQRNIKYILESVHFIDANIGTAVGWTGKILRTTNGGSSWIYNQMEQKLTVFSSLMQTLVLLLEFMEQSSELLMEVQTGSNNQMDLENLRSVFFADANNGTTVCDNGIILHTTNSGTNWTAQTSGTSEGLNGVSFLMQITELLVITEPSLEQQTTEQTG